MIDEKLNKLYTKYMPDLNKEEFKNIYEVMQHLYKSGYGYRKIQKYITQYSDDIYISHVTIRRYMILNGHIPDQSRRR